MTTLETFANGDVNYVAKLNNNFTTIESVLNGIQAVQQAQVNAAAGPGEAFKALFGLSVSVIGAASYGCTTSGTDLLVAAGFCWKPSELSVVSNASTATLHFATYASGTYYVSADSSGAPIFGLTDDGNALYSVVWTGSAFGTITRLAQVVWGAEDDIAAQVSAALGATYDTLDARLEAGETKAVAGDLARTWQTGRLSLSVAGSADVTLTEVQANNTILDFTGALTGNINVIVPLGTKPRMWLVTNSTSGAFTLTVKGATGTGEAVTQGGSLLLFQDSTNVVAAAAEAASGAAADVSVADAGGYYTGTDVEAALQEIGASIALLTGSTDVDTDQTFTSDTGSTADSDPGAGLFKWNHATQASATAIYVDNQTADAVSLTTFFASLPPDGYIHLVQDDDATKWQLWKWSGLPTAGSGYYKFTGLTLMASGGSIADDKSTSVSFKGTPPATQPFDVHAFYPGIPTASAKVLRVPIARAVTFPANFSGSYFAASANATGTTVFDVQKNGSSIGSASIAAGGTTPTFTTSGGASQSFAAGDVISIIGPVTPDATLADPGFVLAGTR